MGDKKHKKKNIAKDADGKIDSIIYTLKGGSAKIVSHLEIEYIHNDGSTHNLQFSFDKETGMYYEVDMHFHSTTNPNGETSSQITPENFTKKIKELTANQKHIYIKDSKDQYSEMNCELCKVSRKKLYEILEISELITKSRLAGIQEAPENSSNNMALNSSAKQPFNQTRI